VAHIVKRQTAGGAARWDVRWKALGRWQLKTFKRRTDADAFRRTVEADELRGVVVDVRRSSAPFEEFATAWLATRRRPDGRPLTASTRSLYADLLGRLILPTFGPAKLSSIQPAQVRTWHSGLADRISPLQAAKAYRLMRTILNTAVRDGLLAANPCNIEGGGVERSPERPLIDTEAVFDLADAIDPRYRALILLIAFGPGARKGEFRAYRRRHVDLLHARIRTEVQEQDSEGGGLVTSAPKNDSSRWTTLPEFLVAELTRHLHTYAQPDPDGYLFTGPKGGPIAPVHWYKSFRLAREAVGLPELHPHDLRHAAGTLFAQQGATTREIMARLGHRSRAAADRYQHAAARRDAELAARLDFATEAARSRRRPAAG
jgi:integrase